jgi:hypothetical protein
MHVDELGLVRLYLNPCYVEQLQDLLGLSLFQKLTYNSRLKRIEASWDKALSIRVTQKY